MLAVVACGTGLSIWVLKFCVLPEPPRQRKRRARLRKGVNVCIQKQSDRTSAREITGILRAHGIEYSIVWAAQRSTPGAFMTTGKDPITLDQLIEARDNGFVHELVFG